jgi:hypothetical protein
MQVGLLVHLFNPVAKDAILLTLEGRGGDERYEVLFNVF